MTITDNIKKSLEDLGALDQLEMGSVVETESGNEESLRDKRSKHCSSSKGNIDKRGKRPFSFGKS